MALFDSRQCAFNQTIKQRYCLSIKDNILIFYNYTPNREQKIKCAFNQTIKQRYCLFIKDNILIFYNYTPNREQKIKQALFYDSR